jgi:hypothetical protein
MSNLSWILTGGFAKGYRTYIMAGVVVLTAIASYAVGDADLVTTISAIATGIGLGTLRAAVPSDKAAA